MKNPAIGIALLVAALLVFAGCGDDDDCINCPQPEITHTSAMTASLSLWEGMLTMRGAIVGLYGFVPEVDSVLVDGEPTDLAIDPNITRRRVNIYFEKSESEKSSAQYADGDLIHVEIYTPEGKSECWENVLNADVSVPQVESVADQIDVGTDLVLDWDPIEHAEWYAVDYTYNYYVYVTGYDRWQRIAYTTDSRFTLDGREIPYDGDLWIIVAAYTGPIPNGGQGNITGGTVQGSIRSYAYVDFSVQVGQGSKKSNPTDTGGASSMSAVSDLSGDSEDTDVWVNR